MSRAEFVKTWGDKYLGTLARAAAMDKSTSLYARWVALQVHEIDGWLGALHDALAEELERAHDVPSDNDVSLVPRQNVQRRWAVRALLAIWSKVIEPAMNAGATDGPMKELPAPLLQWLANADNRAAVADWLKEEENAARGNQEAA